MSDIIMCKPPSTVTSSPLEVTNAGLEHQSVHVVMHQFVHPMVAELSHRSDYVRVTDQHFHLALRFSSFLETFQ